MADRLPVIVPELLDHGSDPISQNLREVSIGHLLDGDLQGSSYAVTTLHAIASIVVVAGEVFFQEKFEAVEGLEPRRRYFYKVVGEELEVLTGMESICFA
uniref:Uncharacterized protein n=1 Tax=Zea mays TaxID=4577 RepID=A0A804NJE2_MAIZE